MRMFMKRVRHCSSSRPEDGTALLTVIAVMVILSAFVNAALAYAAQTRVLARHGQDFDAALSAAQAGIDDFIRRLNARDDYWLNPDCSTNPALRGNRWPKTNTACYSPQPGWQYINPGDPYGPRFHYDFDASTLGTAQYIVVVSTGAVGNPSSAAGAASRSLRAEIKRSGSTDFVYYTDFEDADPQNKVAYPSPPNSSCIKNHWWEGRSGCAEITFVTGDVLNGRMHTNDTPLVTGQPEFVGLSGFPYSMETSDPACKNATSRNNYASCYRNGGSANPIFDRPPGYVGLLQLPDNSASFSGYPGCQFVGQTRIKFLANGTMQVWSPRTTSSNSSTTATCGGSRPAGVIVPIPDGQVIYARNDPSVAPYRCATGEIGDGLPVANDTVMDSADQYCGQGTVYVEGTVNGRITVAAENDVVVTGDILLAGGPNGDDIVGLVASNSVEVMHPWVCTNYRKGVCQSWSDSPSVTGGYPHRSQSGKLQVYASIQTLQHSFWVQAYDQGSSQGTLYVYGSIAQRYRGAVGTTAGTGYLKSYNYDPRLVVQSPPYFPQWQNATWTVRRLGELPAQYSG